MAGLKSISGKGIWSLWQMLMNIFALLDSDVVPGFITLDFTTKHGSGLILITLLELFELLSFNGRRRNDIAPN